MKTTLKQLTLVARFQAKSKRSKEYCNFGSVKLDNLCLDFAMLRDSNYELKVQFLAEHREPG